MYRLHAVYPNDEKSVTGRLPTQLSFHIPNCKIHFMRFSNRFDGVNFLLSSFRTFTTIFRTIHTNVSKCIVNDAHFGLSMWKAISYAQLVQHCIHTTSLTCHFSDFPFFYFFAFRLHRHRSLRKHGWIVQMWEILTLLFLISISAWVGFWIYGFQYGILTKLQFSNRTEKQRKIIVPIRLNDQSVEN